MAITNFFAPDSIKFGTPSPGRCIMINPKSEKSIKLAENRKFTDFSDLIHLVTNASNWTKRQRKKNADLTTQQNAEMEQLNKTPKWQLNKSRKYSDFEIWLLWGLRNRPFLNFWSQFTAFSYWLDLVKTVVLNL